LVYVEPGQAVNLGKVIDQHKVGCDLVSTQSCRNSQAKKTTTNKSTSKVEKQLANLARREQSLAARVNRMTARPVPRRRAPASMGAITSTEIPMEVAYTVRQPTSRKIHRETACEYIGDFVILPTSTQGDSVKFMMNPLTLPRTRLYNLARNYQKFRFTRLALKVQSSTTTSTNGLYVVGYNSNPDAEYTRQVAVPAVFDLPGAQSANVWRTITSVARIEDRNKWYNLDPDSDEVMQTTQGYFAVVVQSPTSATGPLVMPVLLEYSVEFTGSSYNSENLSTPFVWPAGTWAYNSVTGNFTFTPAAGEPVGPTIPSGAAYIVNPEYPVLVGSDEDTIGVVKGTTASWVFYRTIEDLNTNKPLQIFSTFSTGRTTWTLVSN